MQARLVPGDLAQNGHFISDRCTSSLVHVLYLVQHCKQLAKAPLFKLVLVWVQVGIPYPPLMDTRVRLKRQHNDANAALLGSGSSWYAAEAFRAVNQAVGTS